MRRARRARRDRGRTVAGELADVAAIDRKSTRLNSSHRCISYAVFCLKKKTEHDLRQQEDQAREDLDRRGLRGTRTAIGLLQAKLTVRLRKSLPLCGAAEDRSEGPRSD